MRIWLLWRYLLVDRFAVRSSNPCRHGRACPGHPRRAAARTSPASARPAGRRTVVVRRTLAVMAGLVPAIHAGSAARTSQRDKSANFGSYGVMCWSTGLLFVRRTLAVMAGLVPAIHAGPPQERVPPRRDRQEGGRSQGFSRLPASMRWAFGDGRDKPGHDALMAPSATSAMLPIPSPQQPTR